MSTSLKVLSIAAVLCASTSRLAMVARRFDIRTRSSVRSPSIAGRSATGAAGRVFACSTGVGRCSAGLGAAAGADDSAARSTSRLITRPASPVPCTREISTSFCSAAFLAAGVARDLAVFASVAAAASDGAAAAGAGAPGASGASSMTPSTSPTFTSSPSFRSMRLRTPADGAPTSRSILSVSSSTSGSPADTRSPSLRSHLAIRASTMDSPTSGTTMFAGICFCLGSWCQVPGCQVRFRGSRFGSRFEVRRCSGYSRSSPRAWNPRTPNRTIEPGTEP